MKTQTPFHSMSRGLLFAAALTTFSGFVAHAQLDPADRQILHVGGNASLRGQEPMGAYAFYYWNMPNVPTTNEILRLVIAPVYVDGDLGFKGLITKNTDLAVGAFGGLYANSYQEVDAGNWKKDESFDGNGGGARVSLYHRVNPDQQIPLTLVLRETMNYVSFDTTDNTGAGFELPQNQPIFTTRAGFRWGGKEPVLTPTLAMEVSGWYEIDKRTDSGDYGYGNDRRLESATQRIFGRAQINYTTVKYQHYIVAGLMGGKEINPDRLGAFRLGGVLPYTKEFPLMIPGYGYQELSAQSFGLAYGAYCIPFGSEKQWSIITEAAGAVVQYIDGTGQSGAFNSGVGAGLGYSAPSRRWKVYSLAGYGIEAKRGDDRGGFSLGMAFQYNFGPTKMASDEAYEKLQDAYDSNAEGVTR